MKFLNFLKKKPNVIVILMDGVRADSLDHVPFYQELKKESIFFSHLITHAPYSIVSENTIFSGMHGAVNGVNSYYKAYNFDKGNCFTLTQYLKDAGYYTELDIVVDGTVPNQGFDKVRIYGDIRNYENNMIQRHSEVLNQIKTKQPFFLFLEYDNIHTKYIKPIIKKYSDFDNEYFTNKNKNFTEYLKIIKESAEYLKAILAKIKELDLYDDSIILIFSDHGCSVGDRKGEKAYGVYLYDYTLRCFLYLIGKKLPKGIEIKNIVRSIDILPTTLDILKIPYKEGYKPIQGKSFLLFLNGQIEERVAYCETGGLGGPTPSRDEPNVFCVRTNTWKLIYNKTNGKKELYNLEEDKEEKNNLIGKNPKIEKYLWEEMQKNQE